MTIYEPVIGLEIHAELLTKSKMFCGCSAVYSATSEPNMLICPVCTALQAPCRWSTKKRSSRPSWWIGAELHH